MNNKEVLAQAKEHMLWIAVRDGAMKRSHMYAQEAKASDRKAFQSFVRRYCREQIFDNKTETDPYRLIDGLVDGSRSYSSVLKGGQLRYGNAQKFINLYLKYMWLMGLAAEPEHFPVDSVIQRSLGTSYKWTNMSEDQYRDVMKAAEKAKGKRSMAMWEASEYYRIVNKG